MTQTRAEELERFFRRNPKETFSVEDIHRLLPGIPRNSIFKYARRLADDGIIIKGEDLTYRLANGADFDNTTALSAVREMREQGLDIRAEWHRDGEWGILLNGTHIATGKSVEIAVKNMAHNLKVLEKLSKLAMQLRL